MLKKIIALMLVAVMCILLSGCAGKSDKEEQKDYYSVSQEIVFDNYFIASSIYFDNAIYAYYFIAGNGANFLGKILKYDLNTKDIMESSAELAGNIKYMYFNAEGELVVDFDRVVENASDENTDKNVREEWKDTGTDTQTLVENTYIFNKDLELVSKTESEPVLRDAEYISEHETVCSIICDDNGNIWKLLGKGLINYRISIEDNEGNEIKSISLEDKHIDSGQVFKLYSDVSSASSETSFSDDKILLELSENDAGVQYRKVYEMKLDEDNSGIYKAGADQGQLGNEVAAMEEQDTIYIYSGYGNSLLISTMENLCLYDCETGEKSEVIQYSDYDIYGDKVVYIFMPDENTYGFMQYYYDTDVYEVDLMKKKDGSMAVNRQDIHLACLGIDDEVKQKAYQFNRVNGEYRIVIDDYFDDDIWGNEAAMKDAVNRFNADIATNGRADIVYMNGLNITKYAKKGILEDLSLYLENDSDIKEEDFISNILDVYKVNDSIYIIPTKFTVRAMVGATRSIGEESSWNIDEFIEYVNQLPTGTKVFSSITSATGEMMFSIILDYNLNEFVNWKEGTCDFTSEKFTRLLEFCKEYKSLENSWNDDEQEVHEVNDVVGIRSGRIAMYRMELNSIDEYLAAKLSFGEDITVRGYPTNHGNGLAVYSGGPLLAISSKSKNKAGAWEFIKQFYTYEEQTKHMMELPIRKDALDKLFEVEKNRETQTAPDGTEFRSTWGYTGFELYIPNPDEEDIDNIKRVIDMADTAVQSNDEEINSIIEEEAESFFKGQKSAKEVADVIQSRVELYIKENS